MALVYTSVCFPVGRAARTGAMSPSTMRGTNQPTSAIPTATP